MLCYPAIRRRRRRGYTLVIFVLLVFGILGLAAVVIDVGFARLAQRQMKTATDTAALEGLRGRDMDKFTLATVDADAERRMSASEFAALMFDDDLDPATGDTRNFGAGPRVELSGGAGDPSVNASQLLTVPASPVYKPLQSGGGAGLELNGANEIEGDLVAGDYDSLQQHDEDASYTRVDFNPLATQPNAFLARMRRTNDFQGLDQQAAVSSAGPALPLLFGRGALLPAGDPSAGYSPRHHGLTVRATSIAQGRRVQSVGAALESEQLPGTLPFVIYDSAWGSSVTASTSLVVNANGELLLSGTSTVVGVVINADGASQATTLGDAKTIQATSTPGDFVAAMVAGLPDVGVGYVPIVADPSDPLIPGRVVGFGFASGFAADTANPDRFVFTQEANVIAYENASTMGFRQLNNETEFNEIWRQHHLLQAPLLAPALVR